MDVANPSAENLWIGAASATAVGQPPRDSDPYCTRLGGAPVLFRIAGSHDDDDVPELSHCPLCNKTASVRLLCQFYAPLGDMERMIYVLLCEKCGSRDRASAFCVRSVTVGIHGNDTKREGEDVRGSLVTKPPVDLFTETDDWGDDDAGCKDNTADASPVEQAASPAPVAAAAPPPATQPGLPRVAHSLSGKPLRWHTTLPVTYLDFFEDSLPRSRCSAKHDDDQECNIDDVVRVHGADVVDLTSVEEDDESAEQKLVWKYFDTIASCPAQCVRWQPGGEPLLCRANDCPAPTDVPPCQACGSKRRFECQVVSPVIYFLTKNARGEDNHSLRFGTILVFTCSADCDTEPYVREYCYVQREI